MENNTIEINYQDKILWFVLYPFMSIAFVYIGSDNFLNRFTKEPYFLLDILLSFTLVFMSGWYILKITKWLDKKYDWRFGLRKRNLQQLMWGGLLPLVCSMLFEVTYLLIIKLPIRKSSILNLELPLSILFLGLANTFYVIQYFLKYKELEISGGSRDPYQKDQNHIEQITVQSGSTERKLDLADCAYIKSAQKVLWVVTFSGDQFRISGTLDEWENKLDPSFYRINRQYITSRNAIKAVEQTETRKLKLEFFTSQPDDVFVSKQNAASFRKWWNQ